MGYAHYSAFADVRCYLLLPMNVRLQPVPRQAATAQKETAVRASRTAATCAGTDIGAKRMVDYWRF